MLFSKLKNKKKNLDLGSSFSNPEVLEVNLIKDEMEVDFELNKRLFSLFLVLFVAGLFVAEIYFGLDWWQKEEEYKAVTLQNDYIKVTREVKNIKAKVQEVTNFKDKLVVSKKMMDNHIYWTNFFTWLEKNTLNSVLYNGFSGDVSGIYTLGATAKNYRDISWQVKNFQNDKYVNLASVSSGSYGKSDQDNSEEKKDLADQTVNFSIELEVKPEIFFR